MSTLERARRSAYAPGEGFMTAGEVVDRLERQAVGKLRRFQPIPG